MHLDFFIGIQNQSAYENSDLKIFRPWTGVHSGAWKTKCHKKSQAQKNPEIRRGVDSEVWKTDCHRKFKTEKFQRHGEEYTLGSRKPNVIEIPKLKKFRDKERSTHSGVENRMS
jgi:hypothetical protein